MTGTLKSLEVTHGFINSEGRDYFFHRNDFTGHWNDLKYDFKKGNEVKLEFQTVSSTKGLRAGHVKRLDWPNQS